MGSSKTRCIYTDKKNKGQALFCKKNFFCVIVNRSKPGSRSKIRIEKVRKRRNVFVFKGKSMVDDKVVSEAELTAMIV